MRALETLEKARLMVETFTNGLAAGVKHFDHRGRELKTVKEILEELRTHGSVSIKFPDGVEYPTNGDETGG